MRCGVVWGKGREIAQPHFPEDKKGCAAFVLCSGGVGKVSGAGLRGRDIRALRRVGNSLGIGMCDARMDAIFTKRKNL